MKKEDMIEQKLEELRKVATVLLNGNAFDLINMMASLLEKIAIDTGCSREELLIALLMGGDHHGC